MEFAALFLAVTIVMLAAWWGTLVAYEPWPGPKTERP